MAGINQLLYGGGDNKIDPMLTMEEVMENLHIKDKRTFLKLIKQQDLPHIKIGQNYVVPLSRYNQWIKSNTVG